MVSIAFTVIDSVVVMLLFATDVAVSVAVVVTERVGGAVYTTVVLVLSLNVPGPDRVQVTPPLVESLATVAVMVAVSPGFSDCPEAGDSVIVRELLPPEQPAKTTAQTRIPNANDERTLNFLKVAPLKVVTISLRNSKPLEREQSLQIDPTRRGTERVRPACERVRFAEQRRIEIAHRRRQVHAIKNISCGNAEG
jgi:hypothetical protein